MKRLLFTVGLFLIPAVVSAAWIPKGFQTWDDSENPLRHTTRIGGEMVNYDSGNDVWLKINNNLVALGDSAWENNTAILNTAIDTNGVSAVSLDWKGSTYTTTVKLNRLMWLNTSTWDTSTIFRNPNFGTYSQDSNIVKWTNVFPKVDYAIRKLNGRVEHGIFFKKLFLDSAVKIFNLRTDSADIALANVIVYTLSTNIDNHNVPIGNFNKRKFKNFGKYFFGVQDGQVFFPGSDTLQKFRVRQRWLKWNNKIICVEFVKMGIIKDIHETYPNATIWHNTTTKIEGQTDVEDAWLFGTTGFKDNNYGGTTTLFSGPIGPSRMMIRVKNVATNLGVNQNITAATCSVYVIEIDISHTSSMYRIFKPWVEGNELGVNDDDGDVTWNDWASDASEWTTASCDCAGDDGSDNSQDGGTCNSSGRDRKSTADDATTIGTYNVFEGWDIDTAVANGWYSGSINEEGHIFIATDDIEGEYNSTEHATASVRPFYTFIHEATRHAPDFQTSNTATGTASSITVTKPTGTAIDDLLVFFVGREKGSDGDVTSGPTGWTLENTQNNGTDNGCTFYWVIATSTQTAATDFTWNFETEIKFAGGIARFNNVDPLDPIDTENQNTGNSASQVANGVTTTDDSTVILFYYTHKGDGTYTPTSGLDEIWDVPNTSDGLPGNFLQIDTLITAGATGNKTAVSTVSEVYTTITCGINGKIVSGVVAVTPSRRRNVILGVIDEDESNKEQVVLGLLK